jgi:hypothetical protein
MSSKFLTERATQELSMALGHFVKLLPDDTRPP